MFDYLYKFYIKGLSISACIRILAKDKRLKKSDKQKAYEDFNVPKCLDINPATRNGH